jgi:hypothetical protein
MSGKLAAQRCPDCERLVDVFVNGCRCPTCRTVTLSPPHDAD